MPKRKIAFTKGTYYHIYNRGCNKQQLFFSGKDFERFYEVIEKYKIEFPNINILSHCILPNHFHFLLVEQDTEPEQSRFEGTEAISIFMRKIQQTYAMFFNKKYGEEIKKGLKSPVFEGRFKAKIIVEAEYLEYVKMYVEWNAVKHGLVKTPEKWLYSSYKNEPSPGLKCPDLK